MAKCKGCDAEIVWGITSKNNKRIPLDANPETRPVQVGTDEFGIPIVDMRFVFMPHHATCPKVSDFRKAK